MKAKRWNGVTAGRHTWDAAVDTALLAAPKKIASNTRVALEEVFR